MAVDDGSKGGRPTQKPRRTWIAPGTTTTREAAGTATRSTLSSARTTMRKVKQKEEAYQKRLTRRDGRPMTLAQSKKMAGIHADHNAWEENRMLNSGVVVRKEVDLDFETEEENRVMLLVHDMKPPFLEGKAWLSTKKAEMVLPVKDPTSDMAMIARRGSTLMKEVRAKTDENKSRDRFWEMKGSKMGNVTGTTKKEDDEAAAAAEAQRKQAADHYASATRTTSRWTRTASSTSGRVPSLATT